MLLLNYSHPLSGEQYTQLTTLLGATPDVRDLPAHIDRSLPLATVAVQLADQAGLSPEAWQTHPLLLNPPALAPVATALVAELHGRCGYFLPIIHVRPVAGAMPPRYEIAEVVDMQTLRQTARIRR